MIDDEIDRIFNTIDDLLLKGEFDLVNQTLIWADVDMPLVLAIAYLTITSAAKDKLPARAYFYNEILKRTPPEKLRALEGLE